MCTCCCTSPGIVFHFLSIIYYILVLGCPEMLNLVCGQIIISSSHEVHVYYNLFPSHTQSYSSPQSSTVSPSSSLDQSPTDHTPVYGISTNLLTSPHSHTSTASLMDPVPPHCSSATPFISSLQSTTVNQVHPVPPKVLTESALV